VKTVLVMGTLDTKARELAYLQERIAAEGANTLLMDVSCQSGDSILPADISCEAITKEVGKAFEEIGQLKKISALTVMSEGAGKIARRMIAEGKIHGIIALGGGNGTEMACGVMRSLPIGFPKLMVTCVASGNVRPYVGTKDIMMMNSIGDISLNRITKRVFNNAARAIAGMVKGDASENEKIKPQIGISTFAVTLACVEEAKRLLEERAFEVIELHASGAGGMALEELVRAGEINGVLDMTTSELVDALVGGMYSAGPHRMEAAASTGIPQVVSLGALDIGNFGAKETVPEKYRTRRFYFYTPSITLMRTSVGENRVLGEILAEKANRTTGPMAIIIPGKGFSALDRFGGPQTSTIDGSPRGEWHDEEANSALIDSIKDHIDASKVKLVELNAHINDPEVAERAVDLLTEMMGDRPRPRKR
jgi:uncharacterized protein (UPF0261 family)